MTGNAISPHPRWRQPLSHGAARRDSSPFRGAEGWAKICGVYASVYNDADTSVSHSPVRGGVLDAPRSRDRRGELVADVQRDRLHPRLIRPHGDVHYPTYAIPRITACAHFAWRWRETRTPITCKKDRSEDRSFLRARFRFRRLLQGLLRLFLPRRPGPGRRAGLRTARRRL